MHYAEFAEDESAALLNAIKEYENNKWKTIGQKVGKPAKVCRDHPSQPCSFTLVGTLLLLSLCAFRPSVLSHA
jgi:hypothetical protein